MSKDSGWGMTVVLTLISFVIFVGLGLMREKKHSLKSSPRIQYIIVVKCDHNHYTRVEWSEADSQTYFEAGFNSLDYFQNGNVTLDFKVR